MVVLCDMSPRMTPDDTDDLARAKAVAAVNARAMGRWIRLQREERGWSQKELGNRLGMDQERVSDYERGESYMTGRGSSARPWGWRCEEVVAFERVLLDLRPESRAKGTLFRVGGYVPDFDLDTAVATAPDLLEGDKQLILAMIREARKRGS